MSGCKTRWATASKAAMMAATIATSAAVRPALAMTPATQPADPSLSSPQEVADEVRALRAEVQALKTAQQSSTAGSTSGVMAAATTQPAGKPLMAGDVDGFMSGFTLDRFTLQSTDGKFVLRPWLHLQARTVVNDREDFKVNGKDDTDVGAELRRARIGLDGNAFGTDLTYFANAAFVRASGTSTVTNNGKTVGTVSNNLGGAPLLEEAWVRYHVPNTDFYLRTGQIKDPIYHESIVSSRYQQATERSLTADIFFNGDTFTEAATVAYDPKTFIRAEAGVDHGIRSANTNFLDYSDGNTYNFGAVGRVEFKAFGRWQDYQMGASGVTEPLLVAGVGSEYSQRGHIGQTVGAADVMYADQNGISAFAGVSDRYTTSNFGLYTQSSTGASVGTPGSDVAGRATNEYALVGELGYLFDKHIEPFGRYEYIHVAGDANGSHNFVQAITAGVNYYADGHRLKLTGQATYLPVGIPIDDTPNDVLASPNGRGEFVFDAQLQLSL